MQLDLAPGQAAESNGVSLLAQVAIPLPSKDQPSSKSLPSRSKPADPVVVSPSVEEGKPRAITPTTGLVTIESDLQQADNTTGIVTATGNVRIVYPDQRVVATARQAQYYSKEGRVVLSGDVDVIHADGHAVKAERVVYDVNRERLTAEPPSGRQVFSRYQMNRPAPQAGGQTP